MKIVAPPQLSVIVPTYQEAANLPILIRRIWRATQAAGLTTEIVVVDDNSRDGTAECCAALARELPVRLIVREHERGLSSAVVTGMEEATGDVLIVMDADLSHPPEKIPELYAALCQPGVDFVIGSRYVHGGKTDSEWGFFRRLNSRVATWLARPLTTACDPMAGFFALRREHFESNASMLNPVGYKIGLELMVKCGCREIVEVPIVFEDRVLGNSKLTLREQGNYLLHLKRLYDFRFEGRASLVQFAAVGASGLAVDLGVLWFSSWLLRAEIARAVAIWTAMTWNFLGNRWLTFSSRRGDDVFREYLRFCGCCLLGAIINWTVSVGVWALLSGISGYRMAGALAGAIVGMGFNFALSRRWVFRGRTADEPADAATAPESADSKRLAA